MNRKLLATLCLFLSLGVFASMGSSRPSSPPSNSVADCECIAAITVTQALGCTSVFNVSSVVMGNAECVDNGNGCVPQNNEDCTATGDWHMVLPVAGGGGVQLRAGTFALGASCDGRANEEFPCLDNSPTTDWHKVFIDCSNCDGE